MIIRRKHYTHQEKAAILRVHLINRVPVSDLCDQYGLHPTFFYRWQRLAFEGMESLFEPIKNSKSSIFKRQIESLQDKLSNKDSVIAQIMEDYVSVKKALGKSDAFLDFPKDKR
ncbi:MAG: transposase [Magnetococcales bacterium]|nr:transposase [Magnetococcales bacterium]